MFETFGHYSLKRKMHQLIILLSSKKKLKNFHKSPKIIKKLLKLISSNVHQELFI